MLKRNAKISLLIGIVAASSVLISGCSSNEPASKTAQEVKDFGGDPVMKAKMGAAIREQAMKNAGNNGQRPSDIPKPVTPPH